MFGVDPDDDIYILDWWSAQETADKVIDAMLDLTKYWSPLCVFGEAGVIRRSLEPFLARRMKERRDYFRHEWITRTADKSAMARSIQARLSMRKVFFPKTDWADEVISQSRRFPAAKHDDKVDALAMAGLALDQVTPGRARVRRSHGGYRTRSRRSWVTRLRWAAQSLAVIYSGIGLPGQRIEVGFEVVRECTTDRPLHAVQD